MPRHARPADATDTLFRVPPSEFVSARNRLAADLTSAGRTDEARTVRRLRRPAPAVWIVNQLANQAADALGQFVQTVERLMRAQMQGAGDVAGAARDQRRALQGLLERAPRVLDRVGMALSPSLVRRLSATLLGAATDRQARAELLQGRLSREWQAPSFDIMAGARPARRRPAPPSPPIAKPRRDQRAARILARTRERQARRLERSAAQRRREAARLTRRVERLKAQLRAAESDAARAQQIAAQAEQAAKQARTVAVNPD